MKAWIVGSIVGLLGSSVGVTWGDTVELKLDANQPNPGLQNSINLSYRLNSSSSYSTYSYAIGALSWKVVESDHTLGNSVYTFCIQIWQDVYENSSYTFNLVALDSTSPPLPTGGTDHGLLTPVKAQLVQGLVDAHYGDITFGSRGADSVSDINAAAMQLAIWEIIYDGQDDSFGQGGTQFFSSGNILAGGANANGTSAVSTATSWLNSLHPNPSVSSFALESESSQDQMIGIPPTGSSPVPLPAALPAGGLLLGGIAILRKVRRKV